jgi:asparagine synthetase B (glutamine-hydrolysing)
LSSGYDSGGICCALNNLKYNNYKTYSILGQEDFETIKNRIKKNNSKYYFAIIPDKMVKNYKKRKYEDCEDFNTYLRPNKEHKYNIQNDWAIVGHSILSEQAKKENYKICLSGQGADEILSDYGHNGVSYGGVSHFGGKFPENLNKIFPWYSFFGGTMEAFIMKEEIINGSIVPPKNEYHGKILFKFSGNLPPK